MTDLVRARSHTDVLAGFQDAALGGIARGEYRPFVWPYRALGPYLVILYLLIPPTRSGFVYALRYPLLLVCLYHAVDSIVWCRSPMVTVGYGIGLLNSWTVLWCSTLILFNDGRSDFSRIEERISSNTSSSSNDGDVRNQQDPENRDAKEPLGSDGSDLRRRKQGSQANGYVNLENDSNQIDRTLQPHLAQYHYQNLPTSLSHRVDWVLDLVCSFRGPRWSHRIAGLAPPPASVQDSLAANSDDSFKPPTRFSYITRRQLLLRNGPELLICYLSLDIIKTLTLRDPYFWSYGPTAPSPFAYPATARILLSLAFTYTALQSIFLLAPLTFACLLGPERIGAHAWPWLYSPYFGSPRAVTKYGLTGVWGMWWQQLFRYGFQEAGEALARAMGGEAKGWAKRTQRGLILRTVVAFGLSGVLHASASYTAMGTTWPVSGSALFFWLQPVGAIGQKAGAQWLKQRGWLALVPWWARECSNAAFVVAWFALTASFIADEFTRTGVWLFEPVPIAIIRGWGGDGWWKWGGTWFRWHQADSWYLSGLAF